MDIITKRYRSKSNPGFRTFQGWRRALMGAVALWLWLLVVPGAMAQPVTFNMKDADISAVIDTVAKVTGKSFIVDPRVKGKITVISSQPMDKAQVYQVFLSVLQVHGFAAVPSGNTIKIVPAANAKQTALPISPPARAQGDELVTQVVAIEYVDAPQLVPILRPLVPQQGHMAAYPPTNVLIISDTAANIQRLREIISRVDIPSGEDEVEVITLEHAAAAEVVRILTALEQEAAKGAQRATAAAKKPILIADERTNSILVGGATQGRLRLRAIISHLDTPLETGGNTHVVYLRYAQAKDLVPVLTGVSTSVEQEKQKTNGRAAQGRGGSINIQADEATNALVITAPPDLFRALQTVIRQLDVRRAQVLVESIIAEVRSSRAAELGVQFAFGQTPPGNSPVGFTNLGPAGASIGEFGAAAAAETLPPIPGGLTVGVGQFDSGKLGFGALVRALEGDGSTNILSTPTLVTLDNVEAEINVGEEVPFVTGSFTSTGGSTTPENPFQTISRENVGITLKVKPQINEGDAIRLDIEQTVDSLSTSAVSAVDLITNKRSIRTSVIVDDGEMVVLGGLIQDDLNENTQKVPLLGDLPLIGALFRYKTKSKDKSNLMVFLHPVILRDAAMASTVTHSKYSSIRTQQLEIQERTSLLLGGAGPAVLPPMVQLTPLPSPFEEASIPGDGDPRPRPEGALDLEIEAPFPEDDR